MTGFMNLSTQGLQRTWPQGIAIAACVELLRALRQAGHVRVVFFVVASISWVKLMQVRVLRESL